MKEASPLIRYVSRVSINNKYVLTQQTFCSALWHRGSKVSHYKCSPNGTLSRVAWKTRTSARVCTECCNNVQQQIGGQSVRLQNQLETGRASNFAPELKNELSGSLGHSLPHWYPHTVPFNLHERLFVWLPQQSFGMSALCTVPVCRSGM